MSREETFVVALFVMGDGLEDGGIHPEVDEQLDGGFQLLTLKNKFGMVMHFRKNDVS